MLARELSAYENRADALVLALPRGGVPVASVVARELCLPLDVFVVRKLGLPGYPELAMGAIASGGVRSLNSEVLTSLNVPEKIFEEVSAREREEVTRREQAYRGERPAPEVAGKTIILVDDGIATGSTMIAGVRALEQQEAAWIVAAAPVIATSTYPQIKRVANEVAAVLISDEFGGVSGFYENFSQTTDDEVRALLELPNECFRADDR